MSRLLDLPKGKVGHVYWFLEQHETMLEKTTPGTRTWYPESQALSTRLVHSCDLFPWRVDFSHVIKSADFCTLGLGRAVSPGLPTRELIVNEVADQY